MVTFEVQLIPQGGGRWAALLANGQLLLTAVSNPGGEVAMALLRQGADPRSRLVIRTGATVVVDTMLGVVSGVPVVCGDVDVIEKD
jgi:hypothetical protein